jgi:hypothetical protein
MPPERERDEDDEDQDEFMSRWHRTIDSQHAAIEWLADMLDDPKNTRVRLHEGDIVTIGRCAVWALVGDDILTRASNYLHGGGMPLVRASRLNGTGKRAGVRVCIQVPQTNGEPAPDSVVALIHGLMNDDTLFTMSDYRQDNLRRVLLGLYGVYGETPIAKPLNEFLREKHGGSLDSSLGRMEWRGTHGWRWRLTYDPVGQDYQLEVLPARRKLWRELSAAMFAEGISCYERWDILDFVDLFAREPEGFQNPWYHGMPEIQERLAFHKPIRDAIAARDEEE